MGPTCMFDTHGDLGVFLRAFLTIKIPLAFTDITIFNQSFELFRKTLAEFNHVCVPEPPPAFARQDGDTLVLNMGPDAGRRLTDSNTTGHDAADVHADGRGESFRVVKVYRDEVEYYQVFFNGQPDQELDPADPTGELRRDRLFLASGITKIEGRGGAGNDRIEIGEDINANIELWGDAGNDEIIIGRPDEARIVTIHGGAGDDDISGHDGDETIYGDAGNDTIRGRAGNDTIYGGSSVTDANSGDDRIFGEAGNDLIYGGGEVVTVTQTGVAPEVVENRSDAGDEISGGAGNDVIFGGAGDDVIVGDGGSDWIFGDADNDTLYGDQLGAGPDSINFNNDIIYGGAGRDDLTGSIGVDILKGGADNDAFNWVVGDGDDTLVSGDAGEDTYFIEAHDGDEAIVIGRFNTTTIFNLPASPITATTVPPLPTTVTQDAKGVNTQITPSAGAPNALKSATLERIILDAGDGADTVTVDDLKGSSVNYLEVDLGLSDGTVSYTHLTLPTICSV